MLHTIESIKHNIRTIALPNDATKYLTDDVIKHIEYTDGKLTLDLAIPRYRDKNFQTFQKKLLQTLKIELAIDKVALNFESAPTTEDYIAGLQTFARPNSRYLTIISGKGGVGKSTVTVQLAKALTAVGKKVAIIDADIYGASIPQIMQVPKHAPQIAGMQVKPFEKDGIELISSSLLLAEHKPVMWKGPMLSKMLKQFFSDIAWSETIDYFLIDMPPGTGDALLELQHIIPQTEMLVVTTPQEDAAYVATKAGLAALDLEHQIFGVLENMSYVLCDNCTTRNYVFGKGGGYYVAEAIGSECIAEIPLREVQELDDYAPVVERLLQSE